MSEIKPDEAGAKPSPRRGNGFNRLPWRTIGTIFSFVIVALTVWVVARTLATVDYRQVRAALATTRNARIALALLFVAGSYIALTGYDAVALRQLKLRVPYRTAALAAFTSYAVSFTLGFPLITGATVRFWIYSRVGLTAGRIASLTVICNVTFWLGMALLIGAALAIEPSATAALDHLDPRANLLIGLVAFGALAVYLVWVSRAPRQTVISGLKLELPGFRLTLGQIALGMADLCCAAGALFVLLPADTNVGYVPFLAAYVFGSLVGIASNVPGGIGAFEATLLKVVPAPSVEALLASLVVFRVLYYGLPFVIAAVLLVLTEGRWRWLKRRRA